MVFIMISWLKYTFGNFFSHKLSKEGTNRKVWNLLFSLFMFLVLLTSFLASGYSFSYWTHYDNASNFQEFAYNTFFNEDVNKRVNIESSIINDKGVARAYYGLDKENLVLINTFENQNDSEYIVNDYNLIIDTRDSSNTFVKFDITYYNVNDKNDVISADEFRKLTSNSSYTAKIDIYSEIHSYTDQDIEGYTSWLNTFISSLDSNHSYVGEWNQIKALNKESKIYKDKTYALYTKCYYSLSIAPTIQTYYQSTYAILDENNEYKYSNYLLITDTWCVISFTTDNGINVTFDGYYNGFADGFVLSTQHTTSEEIVKENIDNFFATIFDSITSFKTLSMALTVFRFYIYIILALLILAGFIFLSCKVKARDYAINYLSGLKIASGYLVVSSLLGGIIGFIASFITSQQISFAIATWGTLALLMIRTLIFVLNEEHNIKKDEEMIKINKALGIVEEKKEIKKVKKVSSDDEFNMNKK